MLAYGVQSGFRENVSVSKVQLLALKLYLRTKSIRVSLVEIFQELYLLRDCNLLFNSDILSAHVF